MDESKRDQMHTQTVMIDVHTHLTDSLISMVITDVIDRALAKNVQAALVVAENVADFGPVIELYKRFPKFVLPCLGIHPVQSTGIKDDKGIEIKRSVSLKAFVTGEYLSLMKDVTFCFVIDNTLDYEDVEPAIEIHSDVIGAIGEVGLDFSPRFCKMADDKDVQKQVFIKQIQLAQKYDLPLNVHSRSAGKQAIQILKEHGSRKVLLHAFDGRPSVALEGISSGFFFSVTASICRDPQVQKMVKVLPLESLMLETDSPAISPVKGTVNEPSNVLISCQHIAQIKNINIEDVKRITTENALKVFPKLKPMVELQPV